MADWMTTLQLRPEHNMVRTGEIGVHDYARIVAERLRKLDWPEDFLSDRDDLADEFESFADDVDGDLDDFDDILRRLYDVADSRVDGTLCPYRKLCWVNTF